MIVYRCFWVALFFLAVLGRATWAQATPDCSKAQTPAEKAICGNPELTAADRAMATAFAALLKALPPPEHDALLADQRTWITERDGGCFDQKDEALVKCLLAATDARRRFLAGEGANGPTAAAKLLPSFFDEKKPDAYEITIAYPQFAPPVGAKFNRAVHDLALDPKTLQDYREVDPHRPPHVGNYYQATYGITHLDPHLVSVTFDVDAYAGGAHPNSWRSAVLWDPADDKPVALSDFLADPAKAVPAIGAACKEKLSVEAKAEDWDFFPDADFGSVVGDVKTWAIDKEGVTIMFNPYSIAAYVVGPRDCRLGYAELKEWLKPGGVLPPK
jgi:uncharacterized protein YecT (DUF1311 family)